MASIAEDTKNTTRYRVVPWAGEVYHEDEWIDYHEMWEQVDWYEVEVPDIVINHIEQMVLN